MFRQKKPYGCGLYALANTFSDENFITDELLEQTQNGQNIDNLNVLLRSCNKPFYLSPLFYDLNGESVPKWVLEMAPSGDNIISIPLFFDVQYTIESKAHFLSADLFINKELMLYDSLREEPELTTLPKFIESCYKFYGIFTLSDTKTNEHYFRTV